MNTGEKRENRYFIRMEEAEELLRKDLKECFNGELFHEMINKSLIVSFIDNEDKYLWIEELELCKRLFILNDNLDLYSLKEIGYNGNFLIKFIKIGPTTYLLYDISESNAAVPAYVRNILYYSLEELGNSCGMTQYELLKTTVMTGDTKICKYIENAIYREHQLTNLKLTNFANSSSYMGTKKRLLGFIIEAMFPHCQEKSIFLDIMCGSGAVSNGLAQMGQVYASDSMEFCRLLAKIQGAGFEEKTARNLLKEMYEDYNHNLTLLQRELISELADEDAIFHMNLEDKAAVFEKYETFIHGFNLYSSTDECERWISDTIDERKKNHKEVPYCLFTYYYSNVYFGLAQCMQLDSIRYAIDQIQDDEEREWALGVLAVVTSAIGTTYGGHFAQPKRVDIKSLEKILEQRGKSAWLEFSKRIISIARESERYPYCIKPIEGPWQNALDYFPNMEDEHLVVYLDAPYKREEYSRYYHILETIVKYDYPASENKGRLRSKKNGERFSTEFFTKTVGKIEDIFERIIKRILDKNAICVWSYSSNGAVSIMNVVERVKRQNKCEIYFYSIPYKHLKQGKSAKKSGGKKKVIEYCVIFKPKNHNAGIKPDLR